MDRFDAMNMLDLYVFDYLIRHNLFQAAEAFVVEVQLTVRPVAVDTPRGFLSEWWSIFWDIYCAYANKGNAPDNNNNNNQAPGAARFPENPNQNDNPPQHADPSLPTPGGDGMTQAAEDHSVPDNPEPPKPDSTPMMQPPDMEGFWKDAAAVASDFGYDQNMLGSDPIPGFGMTPDGAAIDLTVAAMQEMGLLDPVEGLDPVAPMMDPCSSSSHPPMGADNYWPWTAGLLDEDVGPSWMGSTSAQQPPVALQPAELPTVAPQPAEVPQLPLQLGDVPPQPVELPAVEPYPAGLPAIAPQPVANNPEPEGTGSSTSSNSPSSDANY